MKQIGPDGDLIFSSTEFGSGSVGKTEQIAQILKALLQNITITTKSEDTELILSDYYNRSQIDEMLKNYVLIEQLTSEVSRQLTDLLNDPEFSGKYASQEDLNALNEAIKDYSSTIATIKGNQESLQASWNDYRNNINQSINYQNQLIDQQNTIVGNLNSNYSSLASSVSSLQNILNNLNLIELSEFSGQITDINAKLNKIGDLATLKTNDKSTIVAAINELVDKRGDLTKLKTSAKNSIVASINELFQSASDGKSLIAAAITGKGVSAAASDSFQLLANKINSISTGTDDSDADATAEDLALGKIAYAKGKRLVGTHVCQSGTVTPLLSRIQTWDSSDTILESNTELSLASGKKGVLIPVSYNAICSSGDDIAYGPAYYVIDGVEHSIDDYLDLDKIEFNESCILRVGQLLYSNDTIHCDYCDPDGVPVLVWSGIVITE